jgi:hypothetical protein
MISPPAAVISAPNAERTVAVGQNVPVRPRLRQAAAAVVFRNSVEHSQRVLQTSATAAKRSRLARVGMRKAGECQPEAARRCSSRRPVIIMSNSLMSCKSEAQPSRMFLWPEL